MMQSFAYRYNSEARDRLDVVVCLVYLVEPDQRDEREQLSTRRETNDVKWAQTAPRCVAE